MQPAHKLEAFPFRNALLLQQFLGAYSIWTMHAFPIQMYRSFNSFPVMQYLPGIKQCTCFLLEVAVREEGSEFRIKKHLDISCVMNLICLHALNVEDCSLSNVRWIRGKCKFYPSIWKRKISTESRQTEKGKQIKKIYCFPFYSFLYILLSTSKTQICHELKQNCKLMIAWRHQNQRRAPGK